MNFCLPSVAIAIEQTNTLPPSMDSVKLASVKNASIVGEAVKALRTRDVKNGGNIERACQKRLIQNSSCNSHITRKMLSFFSS